LYTNFQFVDRVKDMVKDSTNIQFWSTCQLSYFLIIWISKPNKHQDLC
jgi:hypothetical protein